MIKKLFSTFALAVCVSGAAVAQSGGLTDMSHSKYSKMVNTPLGAVKWTGGFWGERFDVYSNTSLQSMWATWSNPDISHGFRNFEIAAGTCKGEHWGPPFHDGDMYKWLEAVAAVYAVNKDPELDALIASLDGIYSGSASATPDEAAVPETPSYDGRFYSYSGGMTAMGDSTSLSYPASNRAPVSVETPPFSIAGRPVTEYEYALFTEEVPYWSKENRETLIADGMADEGYLDGIMLSSAVMSSRPVRCISWYAASAYCDWYSEKTGKEYSLPTEAEWYRAALSAAGKPYVTTLVHIDGDHSSPSAMMGQLWEFTSTPYVPLMRIGDYGKALELASAYPYDDIIVKGGSYVNDPSSVTIESVGVMDRAATCPYAGFRIVGR